jgi:hypothetical protein
MDAGSDANSVAWRSRVGAGTGPPCAAESECPCQLEARLHCEPQDCRTALTGRRLRPCLLRSRPGPRQQSLEGRGAPRAGRSPLAGQGNGCREVGSPHPASRTSWRCRWGEAPARDAVPGLGRPPPDVERRRLHARAVPVDQSRPLLFGRFVTQPGRSAAFPTWMTAWRSRSHDCSAQPGSQARERLTAWVAAVRVPPEAPRPARS